MKLSQSFWLCSLLLPLTAAADVRFVNVEQDYEFEFWHTNGMRGELWLAEIIGAGVGILDFDGDARMDLWLIQGGPLADRHLATPLPRDRLYRNVPGDHGVRFLDVTDDSGVIGTEYGMGIATGDIDNDGDFDVFLANFGSNQLYENLGNGRFQDISRNSGLEDHAWSVSASFADVNADGLVDLYVANYVDFTLTNHKVCRDDFLRPSYCSPEHYLATSDRLYINQGNRTFQDASNAMGIQGRHGGALGVIADDFNSDGQTDFYVANDPVDNLLWLNSGKDRFFNNALLAGVAVNANGISEASMGVSAEDFDQDGDVDLFLTHLTAETNTLYVNDGDSQYIDRSNASGIAASSLPFTGFGTGWTDIDMDGDLDLISVNGAVSAIPEQRKDPVGLPLRQVNQVWRNDGKGTYSRVSGGPAFDLKDVSRGAAFGDLDNDGDTDVVVTNNNGRARIYRNDSESGNWIGIDVRGTPAYPVVVGAAVWLDTPRPIRRRVRTDGSYASAHDPRILFGLGTRTQPVFVLIQWPDGAATQHGPFDTGRYHLVRRTDALKLVTP